MSDADWTYVTLTYPDASARPGDTQGNFTNFFDVGLDIGVNAQVALFSVSYGSTLSPDNPLPGTTGPGGETSVDASVFITSDIVSNIQRVGRLVTNTFDHFTVESGYHTYYTQKLR